MRRCGPTGFEESGLDDAGRLAFAPRQDRHRAARWVKIAVTLRGGGGLTAASAAHHGDASLVGFLA